MGADILDWKRG